MFRSISALLASVCFGVCLTPCALGQEELLKDESMEPKQQTLIAEVKEAGYFSRLDKTITADFEFFGITSFPVPGIGASLGYLITPDISLVVEGATGQADTFGFKMQSKHYSLGIRTFLGDALFIRTGLGVRRLDAVTTIRSFTTGDDVELDFISEQLGLHAAVGHLWQYEWWYFSVDWLGVFIPMSQREDVRESDARILPEDYDHKVANFNKYGKQVGLQLLRLKIGVFL